MFWVTKKDIETIVAPLLERIAALEANKVSWVAAEPKRAKPKTEAQKAHRREYMRKYYHRTKAKKAEAQ